MHTIAREGKGSKISRSIHSLISYILTPVPNLLGQIIVERVYVPAL
jgi:hypothetical protein